MDKLENLQGQVNALSESIDILNGTVDKQREYIYKVIDCLVGRETKQLLRDADDTLEMAECHLEEMESWDGEVDQEGEFRPIPNSIRKVQHYNGNSWAELAALIRTRQAERIQSHSYNHGSA